MKNSLLTLILCLFTVTSFAADNDLAEMENLNKYFEFNQDKFCDKNSIFYKSLNEFRNLNYQMNAKLIEHHLKWFPKHKTEIKLYYHFMFYGTLKRITNFCFMYWWNPKAILDQKATWVEYMEQITQHPYKSMHSKMKKNEKFGEHVKWMEDDFNRVLKVNKKEQEDVEYFHIYLQTEMFTPENDGKTSPADKAKRADELNAIDKEFQVKGKAFFESAKKL